MTGDFLADMAAGSERRAAGLRGAEADLVTRCAGLPAPTPLSLSPEGFDLIAEVKLTSPAEGQLAASDEGVEARAAGYVEAGAAAISVLTEPDRFGGSLEHLERVAGTVGDRVPVLAKDFLVDPVQILAARAAGAGGVLLIVRMLDDVRLGEMLALAGELGLFTLLEAFDEYDLDRIAAQGPGAGPAVRLAGVNARDLVTLAVDPDRFRTLKDRLPEDMAAVAESGITTPEQGADAVALGYSVALVGTALMRAGDPGRAVAELLAAGRAAAVTA